MLSLVESDSASSQQCIIGLCVYKYIYIYICIICVILRKLWWISEMGLFHLSSSYTVIRFWETWKSLLYSCFNDVLLHIVAKHNCTAPWCSDTSWSSAGQKWARTVSFCHSATPSYQFSNWPPYVCTSKCNKYLEIIVWGNHAGIPFPWI